MAKEVMICPMCKSIVTEADFQKDNLPVPLSTTVIVKIKCPKCKYFGIPLSLDADDYKKLLKALKPK
jgi:hypothetical protein